MISSQRAAQGTLPDESAWMHSVRAAAWERVDALGLPGPRSEAWRYTSLRALTTVPFALGGGVDEEALAVQVAPFRVPHAVAEIVVSGGAIVAALSRFGTAEGLQITPLGPAFEASSAPKGLGGVVPWREELFAALNTALLQDGLVIDVAAGAEVAGPVHVIVVSTEGAAPTAQHLRFVARLERAAKLDVVETHLGGEGQDAFTTCAVEATLAEGAQLGWQVVGAHGAKSHLVHGLWAEVGRDATLRSHGAWMGGAITRSDVVVKLSAPGAHAAVDGLYVLDGKSHTDVHTVTRHAAPRTTSEEGFKAVLGGSAKGVFDGLIVVERDAQKVDAKQSCRAMLVSDDAEMNAKPTLEILADDVKCSHGTAIGQLDRAQLTYLTSRGIPADQARGMLTQAFVADRVDRIQDAALAERLGLLVQERLARVQGVA